MSRSFSQTTQGPCPACGEPVEVEVWLIVDLDERPDLAARIRAGTLHDAPCPHCGRVGQVDTPLLVHDGARRRVFFSPPRNATPKQDQELAQALMGQLANTFVSPYPAYMSRAQGVPRQALPTLLDADDLEAALARTAEEQNPVLETVYAFLDAKTWSESQRVVEAHPELLGAESDALLTRLAEAQQDEGTRRTVEKHRDLLRRCREVGVEAAFAEKMGGSEQGMSSELRLLLQELGQPARPSDMSRRVQLCERALDLVHRAAQPQLWAALQGELGNSLAQNPQGRRAENIERAIDAYQQALEVMTRAAMPVEWATTMMNLANAYRNRIRGERAENIERAIDAYQQALEVRTRAAMPEDHRRTQRSLGRLCFDASRWGEAGTALRGALSTSDMLYQAAATPEARQAELREVRELPAYLAYAVCMGNQGAEQALLQDAVAILERSRARWLSESLALREDRPPDVPAGVWQAFASWREKVQQLQAEARLPDGIPGKRPFLSLSEELRASYDALGEVVDRIRAYAPDFMPDPTFDQVRDAIEPGCPLLYLAVTPQGTVALIVTDGEVVPVWCDLTEQSLAQRIQMWFDAYTAYKQTTAEYQRAMQALETSNLSESEREARLLPWRISALRAQQGWLDALDQTCNWLWDALMGPVVAALAGLGVARAVLVPQGWLGLLPLHAAWTEGPAGHRYALDEVCLTYTPNARALSGAQLTAARVAPDRLLAVDNPDGSLHYSDKEVAAACERFSWDQRKVLGGESATPDVVRALLHGYPVLHFSCHGAANLQQPLEGGLSLAGGMLTLRDVLELRLDEARLAVLSACETGIPDLRLPDEAIALPAGWMQAGAAGVVGSLWSVRDLSTMLLMARFYELWKGDGCKPPEALRQAQRWLRDVRAAEVEAYFREHLPQASGERLPGYVAEELIAQWQQDPKPAAERPFQHLFHWAAFGYHGV